MPSSKNVFESSFWTCMLNSPGDIGETAKALYFTLSMKKNNYEILSARLEDD